MGFSIQHLYRRGVTLLALLCLFALMGCISYVFFDQKKDEIVRSLQMQVRIIAAQITNDTGALSATENQVMLSVDSNSAVSIACLFDAAGNLRSYRRGPSFYDSTPLLSPAETCREISGASKVYQLPLLVSRSPAVTGNVPRPMGEVVMAALMPEFSDALSRAFMIALPLSFGLSQFFWTFGLRLEQLVIKPMRHIASTAQRVSLYKDYSLRVVTGPLDVIPYEIGSLTDSFNAMLKEIEDRDSRLSRKSDELDRARQTAESANLAKTQFLANVSHELRTPLNAIIGFSAIMADQQFGPMGNPRYIEYSRDIQASGQHLLDVINDILDLSKAESGKLSVTFSSLSLPKIIDRALQIVAGQAHQRKIDIFTDFPEKLPKIVADPVRLVQIFLNLLSNSLKFTPEGGTITIRAKAETARQGVHYFIITVEDTGIGMTDAQIRKAFMSFNQADAGLNRKYEGAGLGLPLAKRLVELHHGKIKIESEVGKGTIVTLQLTSDPALLD